MFLFESKAVRIRAWNQVNVDYNIFSSCKQTPRYLKTGTTSRVPEGCKLDLRSVQWVWGILLLNFACLANFYFIKIAADFADFADM